MGEWRTQGDCITPKGDKRRAYAPHALRYNLPMTTFKQVQEYTVTCPNNDGGRIVRNGTQGGHQRYLCRKCGKNFRRPDAFQRSRHFPIQQVGVALQSYFDGSSYREAARSVGRAFRTDPPDEASVFRWVQGYARGAAEEMRGRKVPTGKEWVIDELQVKVGKNKYWLWNVLDRRSRYLLATHLTPKRDERAAEIVLRKAQAQAANAPEVIRTDKLKSYIPAIRKVFPKTQHLQSEGLRAEVNNNLSERMQGIIRERDKVLRAMKSRETGQNYLDGWTVDYNWFRPHMGIGDRTPAQAAGMVVPFKDWRDVAEKVRPITTPNRPDWQTQDERILADKDFRTMDIDTAREATDTLRPKRGDFRVRSGRGRF